MTLRDAARVLAAITILGRASLGSGATIAVNTAVDEDNGNATTPASQGCSLREALQEIALNNGVAYRGCAAATIGGPNTIDLSGAGGTIVVNSLVHDPTDPSGVNVVRNGLLPFLSAASGPVTISGGTVSCDTGANGVRILTENSGAAVTLSGVTLKDCTAGGSGIGILNNGGDLTLNGVTFSNLHSSSGGQGGAINHTAGTLNINGGTFIGNGTSDAASPSAESGDGGAIYGSNVALPKVVNVNGTTFTNNTAANDGGAIYWTQFDALGHSITITGAVFTANTAKGGSAEGGKGERGGGAIYAKTDADHSVGNTDLFLIANGQFTSNTAPNGQGGAILLAAGQLSSIDAVTDPLNPVPAALFPANGGIVGSDFSGNTAGGAATSDAQGGAGGALYAIGSLSIEQSSFVGNTSTNGSGGAVALRNGSASSVVAFANVTFNGNAARQAGGAIANIDPNGGLSLVNDTLSGNTATGDTSAGNTIAGGGAIYNANTTLAAVSARNSILGASTPSAANCAGSPIHDLGNNLQYAPNDTGCGASIPIADPNLAAPSIFGGPNLLVHVMTINGSHSPAQGTGDQPTCAAQPIVNFDATGVPSKRPAGDPSCDIGAFESSTTFPVELAAFAAE